MNNDIKIASQLNLAICILFYEKVEQTIECIASFLPPRVRIYVLNNGSSASSRRELGIFCKSYRQVSIFDLDSNLGVSIGRNFLISHSIEQWLFFVDNDITMNTQDWTQRMKEYIASYDDIEVFIPRLFNAHDKEYISHGSITITGNKAKLNDEVTNDITNTFPGGASFVNRNLFNRLGLYDEQMFVGFEDFELCIRAIRNGNPVKAKFVNDIKLIHNHRQVQKSEDTAAILVRYNTDRIEASFKRICEKHNIVLDNDWRPWVTNQVQKLLGVNGR